MRVVVAPDSFKGSIRADAAAAALAEGWRSVRPADDVRARPMADGGEGTLAAIAAAVPAAVRVPVTVEGPTGAPVEAVWLRLADGTGVVELASTSGIELLGGRLRPGRASTRGFGEAIAAALGDGVARLVLGIGSSASTDGGVGMLVALGARITDAAGVPVRPGADGLADVASVDVRSLRPLPPGGVRVLTDVTSPLLGPRGAAAVFGPQKGLDPAGVARADAGLARLAAFAPHGSPAAPGAGAAGGTGWALGLWGARLQPGAPAVADIIGLPAAAASADLVITGEGAFDASSGAGKVPGFVAGLAPGRTALVAGRIAPGAGTAAFAATMELSALAGSAAAALSDPARWLRAAGAALARRM
ncbi:glycerate kinase [Microbacterium sp. 10M-3C3]|jgi:glycerate kinase|uniref:glycerate kinase n=1 Tax=Microbacterium sp. 10M-3C3 TaxID=2483401 RepID=UPI000F6423E1|nr:glycerate kinase [Microbacterium sp. 10M-3C3]